MNFHLLLLFCLHNIQCDWCQTNGAKYVRFGGEDWFLCEADVQTRQLVFPTDAPE